MKGLKVLVLLLVGGLLLSGGISLSGFFFSPADDVFKKVYGESAYEIGAEGELELGRFGVFAGLHYMQKKGSTTYTKEDVTLKLIPIIAGVRFYPVKGGTSLFLEGGGGTWNYTEEASFASAKGNITGYFAGAGLEFRMTESFFFRFLMRYQFVKKELGEGEESYESDLSGIKTGLGLLLRF